MKSNIFFAVLSLSCVVANVKSDWTGSVKEIVDITRLNGSDMQQMSAAIFTGVTVNCNNAVSAPTHNSLLTPGNQCDQSEIPEFEKGRKDPKSFNVTDFLERFLNSKYGKKMVTEYGRKGVKLELLRKALQQTWGFKQGKEDMTSAFERTFFDSSSDQTVRVNSWYSFVNYKSDCNNLELDVNQKDEVYTVQASCDELGYTSTFVFPNSPYEDLVIYTLCAWKEDAENCFVDVPGGQGIKVDISYGYDNAGTGTYLDYAYVNSDDMI